MEEEKKEDPNRVVRNQMQAPPNAVNLDISSVRSSSIEEHKEVSDDQIRNF